MPSNPLQVQLELPKVAGASEFLEALGALLGMSEGLSGADSTRGRPDLLELRANRPPRSGPGIVLKLVDSTSPRLCLVSDAGSQILPFDFGTQARSGPGIAGRPSFLARDTSAEANPILDLQARLEGSVLGVDHLGLNLPARHNTPDSWIANLHRIAAESVVLPYDDAADISFVVPAIAEERVGGIVDGDVVRKPKLELVRDGFLEMPMIGLAVDTNRSLEDLLKWFPSPRGASRPGDEPYFRSVLLAHPWDSLLFVLDLNSAPTSALELTRILIDGGKRLPADVKQIGGRP